MSTPSRYLYIVDSSPPDELLNNYFTQFDFTIKYFNNLSQVKNITTPPLALLIHSSLFNPAQTKLTEQIDRLQIPLIIISDTSNEEMAITMLENGADDFLIKPINPRELQARITAIHRRIQHTVEDQSNNKESLCFNDYHLYPASRQLLNEKGEEVVLSTSEYNLLLAFLRQPQKVLSREFLVQLSTNNELNPLDRRVDIQISRLRQKIEPDSKRPLLIKTIRNSGYIFTAEVASKKNS